MIDRLTTMIRKRPAPRVVAVLTSTFLALATVTAYAASQITLGNFTVTFNGVTYDFVNNTSTWSYTITAGNTGPNLSHWTIGMCADIAPNNAAILSYSPSGTIVVGLDPTTGVRGLKYDFEQANNTSVTYTFTVAGTWAVTAINPDNQIGIKAGQQNLVGIIDGPACGNQVVPATVAYVASETSGNDLTVRWTTSTEAGNVGFNVYGVRADGTLTMLNDRLIPSESVDSITPQDYVFRASAGAYTDIVIEDVDLFTATRRHGPFKTGETFGARPVPEPIPWNAIQVEHVTKAAVRAESDRAVAMSQVAEARLAMETVAENADIDSARPLNKSRPAPDPIVATAVAYPAFDLLVNTTGLYRVTYEQLQAAGLDLAGVAATDVVLTDSNGPVSVYVVAPRGTMGPGSYVEFYGEALNTLYTKTNVYRISVGAGQRAAAFSNARANARVTPTYMATHTVDKNVAYAVSAPGNDPFYEARLLTFTSPAEWNFALPAEGIVQGQPGQLTVNLHGGSAFPTSPDHHVILKLNGQVVADTWFDGTEGHTVTVSVPGQLIQPNNTLTVRLPGDAGVAYDIVYVDTYSITYPRRFTAVDGQLKFASNGHSFAVDGLPSTDVAVWRLNGTVHTKLTPTVSFNGSSYVASFPGQADAAKSYDYVVTSMSPARSVASIRPARTTDIKSGQAQYLVISHPDFISGLQPLVAARMTDGFSVKVVDVNDVYGAFSHGVFDPMAIKAYIAHAAGSMGTQYVLLVGGDTYDYHNYLGLGSISYIPSLYTRTGPIVGYAPVDPKYADVNNDGVPDVAIGRFPVRTSTELALVVNKTLAYPQAGHGGTAIFAADMNDPDISFENLSNDLMAQLGPEWTSSTAYMQSMGPAAARSALLSAANQGYALINYTGHSGITDWSSPWKFARFFHSSDAAAMTNSGKPSLVVQWGCWNTYYVSPTYNTLAHKFMLSGNQGAAAVLGATTLTTFAYERGLGFATMPWLADGESVGMSVTKGKAQLGTSAPEAVDVLFGWTVMGDPSLSLNSSH